MWKAHDRANSCQVNSGVLQGPNAKDKKYVHMYAFGKISRKQKQVKHKNPGHTYSQSKYDEVKGRGFLINPENFKSKYMIMNFCMCVKVLSIHNKKYF